MYTLPIKIAYRLKLLISFVVSDWECISDFLRGYNWYYTLANERT